MKEKQKTNIIEMDDLKSFFTNFYKNWYIIVIFVSIAAFASYLYTYKLPDIYAAKTQILLKNNETYDYQTQIFKGLGYYEAYQDNTNQIRVISSNDIIAHTLKKLDMNVSYFIAGRLKITEVYQSMPFEFEVKYLNSELYEQQMNFKILNEKECELTYVKGEKTVSKLLPFNQEVVDSDFILAVKKNSNINDKTILSLKDIDYLAQIHSMDNLVRKFKNALYVENLEGTTILELTLEDEIPNRAMSFLDTLAKVYIEYTAQSQYIINENTLANIDKQLTGVVSILDSIENELQDYKSEKSIVDLPKQETEYFNQLLVFDMKKRTTHLWIQSLEALEKYILTIDETKDDKLLPPSFYIAQEDDYLKTAINELYAMQMNRNRALYGATLTNKGIENIDQTQNFLKKNILTYITNSKKGLLQRISDYESQIQDYTNIIKTVPKTQRGLLNIQRKVDVNEKMYMYLLEKRANTIIARAGILPQTSLIETSHSVGVVKPDKKKLLYYFILVGLVVSFLIIFIRSSFFSTIESINELKRVTSLPIIGDIILSKELPRNHIVIEKEPKSLIAENFRTIRTNMEYMASEVKSKVVLITSFTPGEGKTFCSVNISAILAKADKKVLLIELDLHKPKVQEAFEMTSDIGVSTILIGKTNISDAVLPTHINNLSVILAGTIPPNASEIILSKHLKTLFDYGRDNFDYVIIDSPPVGLISDGLIIMKEVDVTLFVLNTKTAKRQIVSIVEELGRGDKTQNLGLILNGVKRKKMGVYYNYNSYSYKYNIKL